MLLRQNTTNMSTPKPLSLDTNSFDAQPCPEATLEDLDTDRFLWGYRKQAIAEEVIAANGRTLPQQLAGLRFYDPTRQCPTHAGVLCFGKSRTIFWQGRMCNF
jgi:ATP-dependent DNA helicase RecG